MAQGQCDLVYGFGAYGLESFYAHPQQQKEEGAKQSKASSFTASCQSGPFSLALNILGRK